MSYITVAEQIRETIYDNWALTDRDITRGKIHFNTEWYDGDVPKPQVSVCPLFRPPVRYFGAAPGAGVSLSLTSYDRYVVNLWYEVAYGREGRDIAANIEQMRIEVVRILNATRESYTLPVLLVIPLDQGNPRHDQNKVPRIYRIEILVQVDIVT